MLNDYQRDVIIAFAENDMITEKTAKVMVYSRNTVDYHLKNIKKKTGLNPMCFFDLIRLYAMATEKDTVMKEMTLEQAIKYLQPIADNAQLCNYQEALRIAMDSMQEVERLRKELEEERYRHDRYVDYSVDRDRMIDQMKAEMDKCESTD